jgi:CCR4-NOT transcription complex subunit 6
VQVVDLLKGEEVRDEIKSVITSPVRRVAEPVPRRLVALGPPVPTYVQKSRFTVLTYNILADLYTTTQQFPTSEPFALQWQYRRQLILKELAMYDADIVCLQEVQSTSFHEDLKPEMDRRGFDAVFKKKTQVCAHEGCGTNQGKIVQFRPVEIVHYMLVAAMTCKKHFI